MWFYEIQSLCDRVILGSDEGDLQMSLTSYENTGTKTTNNNTKVNL